MVRSRRLFLLQFLQAGALFRRGRCRAAVALLKARRFRRNAFTLRPYAPRSRYFADFHPALRIAEIEGRGRGWVLMRPLRRGTVLLVEHCVCAGTKAWWHDEQDTAGFLQALEANPTCSGVQHALSLSYRDPGTGALKRLAPGEVPSLSALRGIVGNNAYGGELYPLVGTFNHDCDANCIAMSVCSGVVAIRTVRSMNVAEDLTLNYMSPDQPVEPRARADRLRWLCRYYGFSCHCARCTKEATRG